MVKQLSEQAEARAMDNNSAERSYIRLGAVVAPAEEIDSEFCENC